MMNDAVCYHDGGSPAVCPVYACRSADACCGQLLHRSVKDAQKCDVRTCARSLCMQSNRCRGHLDDLPVIVPEMLDSTPELTYTPYHLCPHCGVDQRFYGCYCERA